jgi:NAD(P)-dependent dehydrogenase (short-subunit alcohol dehydrogenase family)
MNDQRVVVVTGGASGIGEGIARRFAAAGDTVCIVDLNAERGAAVAAELGGGATFSRADTTDRAALEEAAAEIAAAHSRADILVPCAGILQNAVRVLDMDLAEAERLLRINYLGVVSTCQVFGHLMKQQGSGAIVTIASLTSYRASAQVAYNATKASILSLTESMAAELGRYGIRVNAVAPGYTLTPAMQARIDAGERDPAAITGATALGRFVTPEDVANAVYFLCSKEASAITGATLPVDAGWLAFTAFDAYAAKPPAE